MIKITVNYDLTITEKTVTRIEKRSGIYVFFDKKNNPLYVGQAADVKTRVYSHFKGLTNTSMHSHLFYKCKVFYEDDQLNKDIYELFLINTLKAPVNLSKSYRVKKPNSIKLPKKRNKRTICNHIKKNGEQCKQHAHSNGYCHLHGGNGVTRKALYQNIKDLTL